MIDLGFRLPHLAHQSSKVVGWLNPRSFNRFLDGNPRKPCDQHRGYQRYEWVDPGLGETSWKDKNGSWTIGLSEYGFDYNALGEHTKAGLKKAIPEARSMMVSREPSLFTYNRGWLYPTLATGWSGLRYLDRAAMCYSLDPFAGLAVEKFCPRTNVDIQGENLDGAKKKYKLHFKDGLPPVLGEWSLTLYDKQGMLFGNPANRYSISSITSGLEYQKDGSLTISIQADEPADPKEKRNWLPAPKGEFWLMAHLWQPKDTILKGKWKLPGIEAVK